MTRVGWLTDIHLVFLRDRSSKVFDPEFYEFTARLRARELDALFITGDISEGTELLVHLELLDQELQIPIFFVLGNHDFYFRSIASVRRELIEFCNDHDRLCYLTDGRVERLTNNVGVVGHDGWYDGRAGLYTSSDVKFHDFDLIEELKDYDHLDRQPVLEALGQESADHIRQVLPIALSEFSQVILLTHVPPFREIALKNSRAVDDNRAPFSVNTALGIAVREVMRDNLGHVTVLSGHTHEACEAAIQVAPADGGAASVRSIATYLNQQDRAGAITGTRTSLRKIDISTDYVDEVIDYSSGRIYSRVGSAEIGEPDLQAIFRFPQ